jgi:hypothetical protein
MKEISTVRRYISYPPLTGYVLPSVTPDYGVIVSEWNDGHKKKGRDIGAPAMIVSLPMIFVGNNVVISATSWV